MNSPGQIKYYIILRNGAVVEPYIRTFRQAMEKLKQYRWFGNSVVLAQVILNAEEV